MDSVTIKFGSREVYWKLEEGVVAVLLQELVQILGPAEELYDDLR